MSNKRNIGIDILKIISCLGVVVLHFIGRDSSELNRVLYYAVGFAIPSFFVVHGYFILNRKNNTIEYFCKRILKMIYIAFLWTCIYDVVRLVTGHSMYNPIYETATAMFWQKGTFYQFWFFGSLIILYMLTPVLSKQVQKKNIIFLIALIILCAVIDLISTRYALSYGRSVQEYVRQPLRLWTWVLYYYMGGLLRNLKIDISVIRKTKMGTVPIIILLVCYEYFIGHRLCGIDLVEYFYDNLLMIGGVCAIFVVLSSVHITNTKLIKVVNFISPLIMGVYILHIFFYRMIQPFYGFEIPVLNVCLCICIFITSLVATATIKKIPYIQKLVDL